MLAACCLAAVSRVAVMHQQLLESLPAATAH
jgi:hypothetical protein